MEKEEYKIEGSALQTSSQTVNALLIKMESFVVSATRYSCTFPQCQVTFATAVNRNRHLKQFHRWNFLNFQLSVPPGDNWHTGAFGDWELKESVYESEQAQLFALVSWPYTENMVHLGMFDDLWGQNSSENLPAWSYVGEFVAA
ncbi:hypothetical protein BJ875DRAFT_438711 [Amylocarpus encephaloides]|uniref:C2H2-type domain-containing protein n=1 Tax=Amylocarpus encephaloides TaxID=45428 RepID=A0A9P7YPA3_9HELO|nr:hypothetical protein BJ875DRAFT_438711 [Amylocarpus encephaloides]